MQVAIYCRPTSPSDTLAIVQQSNSKHCTVKYWPSLTTSGDRSYLAIAYLGLFDLPRIIKFDLEYIQVL
jgi:hypothetical protein